MIKYINELKKEDLNDKKVLLRVDFDVSLTQLPASGLQLTDRIEEDYRIKAQKETVDYLVNNGAKVLMVAHLGHEVSDASFFTIVEEISAILEQKIVLISLKDFLTTNYELRTTNLYLLDNIRQDPREIQNDEGFARELAQGFDYYVNDAFAVMHREHASIVAIAKYLPSYAGLLIKKETGKLGEAMNEPAEGKILILGGVKISTKLPVIKNFLDKAEKILIGGAVANNFFKAQGINVGASVVDENVALPTELWSSQDHRLNQKIILPEDVLISGDKTGKSGAEPYPIRDIDSEHMILDIGPETVKYYIDIINSAKMVIWNGPMGLSEVGAFTAGTEAVACTVAGARHSIIGGGDTIAAVSKLGLLVRYDFVSTGGGAMLEFLAGNKLPGLEALKYYD